MKYLASILLLLVMQTADATQCSVNGGAWAQIGPLWTVRVDVKATPGEGVIDLDGYQVQCRYQPGGPTPPWYIDNIYTRSPVLTPGAKFTAHKMGLRMRGVRHELPIPGWTHIVSMLNDGVGHNLDTYMYMSVEGTPGKPIEIMSGDVLGTLYFLQSNQNTGEMGSDMTIQVVANNTLVFEPSTCTINSNNPIDVDFGKIDPLTIGDSLLTSTIQKNVTLIYSCPDPNISLPITITLRGATASFNADALAMTHADLGTGLIRRGVVVGPGKSFLTQLTNSVGSDEVTFSLVRKAGNFPAPGVYTGSATLVMGLP